MRNEIVNSEIVMLIGILNPGLKEKRIAIKINA